MRWETNKAEGFIGGGSWREGDAATKRNCKLQQLSLSLSVIFKNKALFGYMSGFITIRFKSITQSMP
jgi:hypothetical protein